VNSQTLPAKLIQQSGNTLQPPGSGDRSASPVTTPTLSPSSSSSSAFSSVSGVKPKISNLINAFTSKTQEQPKPLTTPTNSRSLSNAASSPFTSSPNSNNGAPSPSPLKAFPVASATSASLSSSTSSSSSHNRVGSKSPTPNGSRPATPPSNGDNFLENDNNSSNGDRSPAATDLTTLPPSL